MEKIAILGAGGWGTALSILLEKKGYKVFLWEVFPEYAEELRSKRENYKFLPGISIPSQIQITSSLEEAVCDAEIIVIAIPSRYLRDTLKMLPPLPPSVLLISAVKGLEEKTFKRMSQVILEELGEFPMGVLSGPSHAEEVARGIPTAVVAASPKERVARRIQEIFNSPFFRVYTHDDIVGVELGGALKNIIAIACGISDGLGYGDNTKAALMTRGLTEIARLGVSLGGRPSTFWGLAGMGDLVVTCTSRYSRNRYVGERIGKGEKWEEIEKDMIKVAEGVYTVKSAYELSKKRGIPMPITEVVYRVLYEDLNPLEGVKILMTREPRSEKEEIFEKDD
ncbi:NAD(P)H-dependent glycerol-3-phosphate dehydrogenase [Candidatus Calescamantes bacterium]|nr:NAD(P)H-dependent glycerol-3-phosphate dehydrogenase [Candidatus Calescamantes bacterium]